MEINVGKSKLLFNNPLLEPAAADLHQDLLGVVLPDGTVLDVSWYPEYDKNGPYELTVAVNGEVTGTTTIKTLDDVVYCVELICKLRNHKPGDTVVVSKYTVK